MKVQYARVCEENKVEIEKWLPIRIFYVQTFFYFESESVQKKSERIKLSIYKNSS